jgi:hypothetical protein
MFSTLQTLYHVSVTIMCQRKDRHLFSLQRMVHRSNVPRTTSFIVHLEKDSGRAPRLYYLQASSRRIPNHCGCFDCKWIDWQSFLDEDRVLLGSSRDQHISRCPPLGSRGTTRKRKICSEKLAVASTAHQCRDDQNQRLRCVLEWLYNACPPQQRLVLLWRTRESPGVRLMKRGGLRSSEDGR